MANGVAVDEDIEFGPDEEYIPSQASLKVMSAEEILSLPDSQRDLIAQAACPQCFLLHHGDECGF